MKFKATVTFPGEPGKQHSLGTDAPNIPGCEALDKWLHGHSAGLTRSETTLHLFDCESDDDALCGSYIIAFSRASHFATAGTKYKVCLKCRRKAESDHPLTTGASHG
jgi:hypothetical protein